MAVRLLALASVMVLAAACVPSVSLPVETRISLDTTWVAPLMVFMHRLGVQSYGNVGSCEHLTDARGTFVSSLTSDDCGSFTGDGQATVLFDDTARHEYASLREQEDVLGLPRIIGIELVFDEHGKLAYAGFGVDLCASYTVQFDPPIDIGLAGALSSRPIRWSIDDLCATEHRGGSPLVPVT